MKSFSSQIEIIGVNPYVEVPVDVLDELFKKAGRTKGPIPVKGNLNGKSFLQTVVKYSSKWRLYLNGKMRTDAGIDVGDVANVKLEYDSKPRTIPMIPRLSAVLKKNKKVKTNFEKLSPYRQKEIVRYLASLKTEESLKRNVAKVISHLSGKVSFAGRR